MTRLHKASKEILHAWKKKVKCNEYWNLFLYDFFYQFCVCTSWDLSFNLFSSTWSVLVKVPWPRLTELPSVSSWQKGEQVVVKSLCPVSLSTESVLYSVITKTIFSFWLEMKYWNICRWAFWNNQSNYFVMTSYHWNAG